MQNRKQVLLISSLVILPFTFGAFSILTVLLGSKWGYVVGFILYWVYITIMVGIISGFDWNYLKNMMSNSSENHQRSTMFNVIAFLPVIGVFFISFLPNIAKLTLATSLLLVFMAVLNGMLEEVYWRGLYVIEYVGNWRVGFLISTLIFGAWHISLLFAKGIIFHGGAIALVGGAYFMGLLWAWVARSVGNIRSCILAHVLVNIFAFTGLFVENCF